MIALNVAEFAKKMGIHDHFPFVGLPAGSRPTSDVRVLAAPHRVPAVTSSIGTRPDGGLVAKDKSREQTQASARNTIKALVICS